MGRARHACPDMLVYLREDRARHQACADANPFIFRTASGKTASIEAPGFVSAAGPSAAHPSQGELHSAVAGALPLEAASEANPDVAAPERHGHRRAYTGAERNVPLASSARWHPHGRWRSRAPPINPTGVG